MNSLEPLEFDECIVDSPAFRSNLHIHEKRLQNTSENIKKIIKEVKELTTAAKGMEFMNHEFLDTDSSTFKSRIDTSQRAASPYE